MAQLKERLSTQLDLIKHAQLIKNQQQQPGSMLLTTSTPTDDSITDRNEKAQTSVSNSEMFREKDFSKANALALSLAPSMAMPLGPGTIPPEIIAPPSSEPASSLKPPQNTFLRQVVSI